MTKADKTFLFDLLKTPSPTGFEMLGQRVWAKHITKEGFLHVDRVGGSDAATGRGRRLGILGDKGTVTGIIGNTAIHLRRQTTSANNSKN